MTFTVIDAIFFTFYYLLGLPGIAAFVLVFWAPTIIIRLSFWLLLKYWVTLSKAELRAAVTLLGILWLASAGLFFYSRGALLMGVMETGLVVQLVGLLVLGYGVAFLSWSLNVIGWRRLLGAPILDKKEGGAKGDALIVTGPYSYTRHPIYYSELHIIVGVFLVTGVFAVLIIALLWGTLIYVVTAKEESELIDRFGVSYIEYAKRVPRVFPWTKYI